MSKLKTVLLCAASCVLTATLMIGLNSAHFQKNNGSLIVDGPATAVKGDILEYKASTTSTSWFLNKTIYQWKVLHHNGEVVYRAVSNNDILVPSGLVDDKFYIVCSAVNYYDYVVRGSVEPLGVAVLSTVVGEPSPVPPGPTPIPPPNPTPPTPIVTGKLFAIAVFDDAALMSITPDQLAVHNSTAIATDLAKLDTEWRSYDKQNPALSDPSWQTVLSKVTLPALFIVDDKGKDIYSSHKLVSIADVENQIKTLRGIK